MLLALPLRWRGTCRSPGAELAARLVFLGKLADIAGCGEMQVRAGPLEAVIAGLEAGLATALDDPRIRIAQNGELIAIPNAVILAEGDELAFLPPVSGG